MAALEFALVLPILLLLVLGTLSVGHSMVVRYVLNNATYDAARACTLARTPTAACARAIIQDRVDSSGGAAWCSSINVTVTNAPEPGYPAVTSVAVAANCGYRGIIATGYLASEGLVILNVRSRAVMPY